MAAGHKTSTERQRGRGKRKRERESRQCWWNENIAHNLLGCDFKSRPASPSPSLSHPPICGYLFIFRAKAQKKPRVGVVLRDFSIDQRATHKQIIKVWKVRPSSRPWQRPLQLLIYQCAARRASGSFSPCWPDPHKKKREKTLPEHMATENLWSRQTN